MMMQQKAQEEAIMKRVQAGTDSEGAIYESGHI